MSTSVYGGRQPQLEQRQQALAARDDLRAVVAGEAPSASSTLPARVYPNAAGIMPGLPSRSVPFGAAALDRAPDLLRGVRHVEVPDAERAERVDDRVGHRRGARDAAPASPTPLTPSGLTGDGVTVSSSSKLGSHEARGSA